MIKSFRNRIWFISVFLKKYLPHIGAGIFISILAAILISFISDKLPQPKPTHYIGLVGEYTPSQLPRAITNILNGGLTSINEDLEPIANLSSKWDISEDGLTYTFYLKDNLLWSNNEPVKASDIKISIPSVDTQTIDPSTIQFTLPSKFSPFPSLLTFPLANSNGLVIGKYTIKLKEKNNGTITQAILESENLKLIFNIYQNSTQAITAYKLGQIEAILGLPYASDTNDLSQYGNLESKTNYGQVVLLMFNQSDANLKDKITRQAIAYTLSDKNFGFEPAKNTFNPNSWAYNTLTKEYNYNQNKAKETIKETLNLELSTTPELLHIAEEIKKQLDGEQFQITIKVISSLPEQYQLYLYTYNIPTDPDQYRDWHSTQATNIGKGSDEKLDKYLEDGRTTQDQKSRKSIYIDFQKVFMEELPALPLYHPKYTNISRKVETLTKLNLSE